MSPEWVRAWKPVEPGVREVFHARFDRYVVARRIDAARKRLLEGEPIALVAAGVGFYDQAHFTRQCKRHVGTPPGRYVSPTGWPRRRWR